MSKGRELLKVRQTAERLTVTEALVRKMIAQRRIEFVRIGRCIRIPADVVEMMVENGTVPPLGA